MCFLYDLLLPQEIGAVKKYYVYRNISSTSNEWYKFTILSTLLALTETVPLWNSMNILYRLQQNNDVNLTTLYWQTIFTDSAHWAYTVIELQCTFVCLTVCVCVCHCETPTSGYCGNLWSKNGFLILGCDDTILKNEGQSFKKNIFWGASPLRA